MFTRATALTTGSWQRLSGSGKRPFCMGKWFCRLEGFSPLPEESKYSRTGLPIEAGYGFPSRAFHPYFVFVAANLSSILRVDKKTGPNSQGVTERPGEFSNWYFSSLS